MPKLTRKQYTRQAAALTRQIDLLQRRLNLIADRELAPCYPARNAIVDRIYDLTDAARELDRRWVTRNWTAIDWQSWSLVARNID